MQYFVNFLSEIYFSFFADFFNTYTCRGVKTFYALFVYFFLPYDCFKKGR